MGVVGGNTALCYVQISYVLLMHRDDGNLSCMRQRDFGWMLWIPPSDRSELSYLGRESGKGDYPVPSKHVFRSLVELAILSPIGDNVCTQIFMELAPYLWLHDIDVNRSVGLKQLGEHKCFLAHLFHSVPFFSPWWVFPWLSSWVGPIRSFIAIYVSLNEFFSFDYY